MGSFGKKPIIVACTWISGYSGDEMLRRETLAPLRYASKKL
jgi:hypothetical protein